jgi:hypothetical protein
MRHLPQTQLPTLALGPIAVMALVLDNETKDINQSPRYIQRGLFLYGNSCD